jgi:hypothetical protein
MSAHSSFAIGRLILHEMGRQQLSRTDLVRRFGFANIAKGMRRLDRLLETGFEPSLMSKIAGALYIDQQTVDHAIIETETELAREEDEARQRDDDHERSIFRPYILIETERPSSRPSIFGAISYEQRKRIAVPQSVILQLLAVQTRWVKTAVIEHNARTGGKIDGFGAVTAYVFRRTFDDAIRFDIRGRVTNYFEARPIEVRPRLGMKRRSPVCASGMSNPWPGGCVGVQPLSTEDDHAAP